MKKLILIGFLSVAVGLAATLPFQLFISGNRIKIHPVVIGDRIYLPLEETARIFRQKVNVDLNDNRIILEPMNEEEVKTTPPEKIPIPEPVILGDIVSTLEPNVTKPLGRITVKIFKRLPGIDDDAERKAVEIWIKKGDPRFLDEHGLVSSTSSDADGQFSFSRVPPGNYELFAVSSISPVEMAYWLLPIKLSPGQTQKLHLDLKDASRLPLKK